MSENLEKKQEVVEEEVMDAPEMAAGEGGTSTEIKTVTKKSHPWRNALLAIIVVAVLTGLLLYGLERQGRLETGWFTALNTLVKERQTAALVNGVKITQADYEKNLKQVSQNLRMQGYDMNNSEISAEVSQQALDMLINTELLKQEAATQGIVATDEEIAKRYNEIAEQLGGEEVLLEQLDLMKVSREALLQDIKDEYVVQALLESSIDQSTIEITEEEIEAVYDEAKVTMPDNLPEFDEAREIILLQLQQAREQELVRDYVEGLRAKAEVISKI